jgi:hypothetical protein
VLFAVGPDSAMGLTGATYGLLFATIAAGSLVGALLADPIIRRLGRSRSMLLGILGGVVTVGIAALTTIPLVIAVAFLIGGITNALWNVVAVSLRQRITPDHILGRINSSYRLVAWGTRPGRRRRRPPRRAPRPPRCLRHRRRAHPRLPGRHDPGHRHRHHRRRTRSRDLTATPVEPASRCRLPDGPDSESTFA